MVRRRIHHSRKADDRPDDFPRRPERFEQEFVLSWAEIARRIGTYPRTLRRWSNVGILPNGEHLTALLEPSDQPDLCRRFTRCSGGMNRLTALDTEPSRSDGEPACCVSWER